MLRCYYMLFLSVHLMPFLLQRTCISIFVLFTVFIMLGFCWEGRLICEVSQSSSLCTFSVEMSGWPLVDPCKCEQWCLFCRFLLARHRAALDVYSEAQKKSQKDWVIELLFLSLCTTLFSKVMKLRSNHLQWSPYLTLPSGWAGCYACPALRPYQFGPMPNPDVTRRSQ